jgi:hypothetical protein
VEAAKQSKSCSDVQITGLAAEQPWIPVNVIRGSMSRFEA